MITEKTSVSDIMRRAYERKILIPAFNASYLPMIKPIVDTLKETHTFGLVEVARPEVEKFGAKSFQQVAEMYYALADLRFTRLHLDHIPVIDEDGKRVNWEPLIQMGLRLGYHSLMIDGSRLSLEENIEVTRRVVELCHKYNRPVEAELGAVLGHESGPLPPYEELFQSGKGFTDPKEAECFVAETKVDWLSVAIGNIHGAISGVAKDREKVPARLNIEHLKIINQLTKIPLVLHGGSGIQKEYIVEAVKNGISKMNIGTSIRQIYERSLLENPSDVQAAQEKVALKIRDLIKEYEIIGSWERL
ncbi:class II fructose-bisphosphate aldolase [Candidatus Aerophobetes bacterium]|nr:class II fructose-bisphosphate aldolase [Candidatus Aerophobetes bacterium]